MKLVGRHYWVCLAVLLYATTSNAAGTGKSMLNKTRLEKELSANKRYGYKMVRDHVRAGRKAQRFELRHGDCGGNKYWNDCVNDRQRIERKENPKNRFQKPGKAVWYGWSMFLSNDYRDLTPTNTTLGQLKVEGWNVPLWHINARNGLLNLWFDVGEGCVLGNTRKLRGKWLDIVVFADYRLKPDAESLVMYINDEHVCTRYEPLITQKILRGSKRRLYFKYGIYNSFVSKWLDRHKTKDVKPTAYKQRYKSSSGISKSSDSTTGRPFRNDWGVKLPTQVVYYDEMRYGKTRDQVDIRRILATGKRAVD